MSKKLLRFLQTLESNPDRPADVFLSAFVRELFPEGTPVDNGDLNYHLDKLQGLIKEMKNITKPHKSNQKEEEN